MSDLKDKYMKGDVLVHMITGREVEITAVATLLVLYKDDNGKEFTARAWHLERYERKMNEQ